ncbi:alpha/beta fold hydrolase [Streptomyces sp. NPDC048566]|uniref:alpha/beta fold hydrolase n=1 Tax=Streptomyces sp. NPDC048566 TaxID=3365569 RepID=UPI0037187805
MSKARDLSAKVLSTVLGPIPVPRGRAMALSERLASLTTLVASLEYLRRKEDREPGGLNDWRIARDALVVDSPLKRRIMDAIGDEKVTNALFGAQAVAGAALLMPGRGRWRGGASLYMGLSNIALYPRRHFGTDGSDQVAILVQTAMGAARLSRTPQVQDALLWYVALQSNLSYAISGWVKLLGQDWREGTALPGIMRTRTYGHEGMWRWSSRHPQSARWLAHGVLTLECLFPLVYLPGGLLVRPMLASAAAFHAANGYFMGLGRFITSFVSMHPAVAYTTTPRWRPEAAHRDDTVVQAAALTLAGAAALSLLRAADRRQWVRDGWPGSQSVATRHGNKISYHRMEGSAKGVKPVVVMCCGLAASPEMFGWLLQTMRDEGSCDVVTYSRAGTGPSSYAGDQPFTLQESVDDLLDLVAEVASDDQPLILVGHSLGGEIARRAAVELGDRVSAVVYLDSAHPEELQRSEKQSKTAARLDGSLGMIATSLRSGMGVLMPRPEWVGHLPAAVRNRAFAQHADSRIWRAGRREWQATEADFRAFTGPLPPLACHALVISAEKTVTQDPAQKEMHEDLAHAHRGDGRVVRSATIDRAGHESLLVNPRFGEQTTRQILDFLRDIGAVGPADDQTTPPARHGPPSTRKE